jgi:hypothetical protein
LIEEPQRLPPDAVIVLNREEVAKVAKVAKSGELHAVVDRAALAGRGAGDIDVGVAGRGRRREGLRRRLRADRLSRAAAALLEANGCTLDLGGNREPVETPL